MGLQLRVVAVAAGMIMAAGCGASLSQSTATAPKAFVATTKQAPAKGFAFKGISGDGRIADHFTTWEYQTIRFKAVVDGADGPLTYRWDSYGQIWGKKDQPEIRWSGPWDGWYDVSCTITDAAGHAEKRSVSVKVWRVPTPPPMPPIPHP